MSLGWLAIQCAAGACHYPTKINSSAINQVEWPSLIRQRFFPSKKIRIHGNNRLAPSLSLSLSLSLSISISLSVFPPSFPLLATPCVRRRRRRRRLLALRPLLLFCCALKPPDQDRLGDDVSIGQFRTRFTAVSRQSTTKSSSRNQRQQPLDAQRHSVDIDRQSDGIISLTVRIRRPMDL